MNVSPEDKEEIDRLAAALYRILRMQRFDDLTADLNPLLKSGVSKSCSANSNGCEIHCQTIAAPQSPAPQPSPAG